MGQTSSPTADLLKALNHEIRRDLLDLVCDHPNRGHDLDEVIGTLVNRVDDPRNDLELHCYHTHLPKLATVGLVTYDWDEREIRYDGELAPDRLQRMIDEAAR